MIDRHLFKTTALALFTALFLSACTSEAGPTLSAPEAYEQVRGGALTLIDIRTPPEWRQTGVAEGARRIDMRDKAFIDQVLAAAGGSKDAPIAIICRTGNRTTYVQKELMARGFTRVFNVREGMAGSGAGPGWIKRGLPVEACKEC